MSAANKFLRVILLGLSSALTLGGCSTLSREECLMGDWYALGAQDGAAGYSAERLAEHRQACSEYRIRPDREAYRAGWQDGIRNYCNPQRGFSEGRSGASYAGVCPPSLERAFVRQYQIGRELYQQELRIQELERERERRKEEHRKEGDRKQEDQHRSDDRRKPSDDSRRREPPPTIPTARPPPPSPPDPPAQPVVQGSQRRGKAPEEMQEAEEPHSRSRRQVTPDPTE